MVGIGQTIGAVRLDGRTSRSSDLQMICSRMSRIGRFPHPVSRSEVWGDSSPEPSRWNASQPREGGGTERWRWICPSDDFRFQATLEVPGCVLNRWPADLAWSPYWVRGRRPHHRQVAEPRDGVLWSSAGRLPARLRGSPAVFFMLGQPERVRVTSTGCR